MVKIHNDFTEQCFSNKKRKKEKQRLRLRSIMLLLLALMRLFSAKTCVEKKTKKTASDMGKSFHYS